MDVRHYLSATATWDGSDPASVRHLAFCGLGVVYPCTPAERAQYSVANYGPPTLVTCAACIRAYQQTYPANAIWSDQEIALIERGACVRALPQTGYCGNAVEPMIPYCVEHAPPPAGSIPLSDL